MTNFAVTNGEIRLHLGIKNEFILFCARFALILSLKWREYVAIATNLH